MVEGARDRLHSYPGAKRRRRKDTSGVRPCEVGRIELQGLSLSLFLFLSTPSRLPTLLLGLLFHSRTKRSRIRNDVCSLKWDTLAYVTENRPTFHALRRSDLGNFRKWVNSAPTYRDGAIGDSLVPSPFYLSRAHCFYGGASEMAEMLRGEFRSRQAPRTRGLQGLYVPWAPTKNGWERDFFLPYNEKLIAHLPGPCAPGWGTCRPGPRRRRRPRP